jgi:hypothetical protein
VKSVTTPDDASKVMTAFRLGWYLAEVRGRNRPGGPPGSSARMPDHIDHALPLRSERSPAELRIEAQSVITALAGDLHVDEEDGHEASFGEAIDNQAKLLAHVRAPVAADALQQGIDVLDKTPTRQARPVAREVFAQLKQAIADQQVVVDRRWQAVADAEQALANAKTEDKAAAEATVKLEQATADGEQKGLLMLQNGANALRHAFGKQADSAAALQAGLAALRSGLQTLTDAAHQAWEDLAELLWEFDAHIQDELTAAGESQEVGYQLGRGLAETYWALDPAQVDGSTGWSFLLGAERCAELGRLVGRLGAYMGSYTAPAVAGTIVIWQSVARTPGWRGEDQAGLDAAQQALYRQTRRWYELIVLGQDPTTLIKPYQLMTNYRTVLRALGLFLPQLVATIAGLGFLGILLFLLSNDSKAAWAQTLTGVLAAVGLSYAGLTGTVKSSAQAMLTRLRQDGYTDLVILAVQTAPPVKKEKKLLEQALNQRRLTPATPN